MTTADTPSPTPTVQARVDAATEAAARAMYELTYPGQSWDKAAPGFRANFLATATAALTAAGVPALLAEVERAKPDWSNCVHGVTNGCRSYRCGSNCDQTYDRMHPCLACMTADYVKARTERDATLVEVADLRAVVERVKTLAVDWERGGQVATDERSRRIYAKSGSAVRAALAIPDREEGGEA